jgi:hypothetical protein
MTERTTPDDITAAVLASFARCPDERLGAVMRSLTAHLHAFVKDVGLTEEEWRTCILSGWFMFNRCPYLSCLLYVDIDLSEIMCTL